jgi:hypothetical protein
MSDNWSEKERNSPELALRNNRTSDKITRIGFLRMPIPSFTFDDYCADGSRTERRSELSALIVDSNGSTAALSKKRTHAILTWLPSCTVL